jgi:hypothetical protein
LNDLYNENYRVLIKGIKKNIQKCKIFLCSLMGRINTFKYQKHSKAIYRFIVIPTKIPMAFFEEP